MSAPTPVDYRGSHQGRDAALRYTRAYGSGYYAGLWRTVEMPLLLRTLKSLPVKKRKCLDFACGTGRITGVAASVFDAVVGVDVSAEMLGAADVPRNVSLINVDLTRGCLGETFDTALAFRFFLNADDRLRDDALDAIARHLRPGGFLVCNIHMSSTSPMGCLYRVLAAVRGHTLHKTMTHEDFVELLSHHGFSIKSTHWYGYLPRPGHFFPRLCERSVAPVEGIARCLRLPPQLAQSFLVVAERM